jgi:hypothetical protein
MRGTSGFPDSAAWLSPSVEGADPSGLFHRLHPLPLQTGWPVAAYFFSSGTRASHETRATFRATDPGFPFGGQRTVSGAVRGDVNSLFNLH